MKIWLYHKCPSYRKIIIVDIFILLCQVMKQIVFQICLEYFSIIYLMKNLS